MYVNGSMQRPLQGISQQPADVRNEGQCTWQENMQPNVVEGLSKRIGTNFIQKVPNGIAEGSKVHFYTREGSEGYWIILEPNGALKVLSIHGVPQPVVIDPECQDYINLGNPFESSTFQTIADTTFICNRNVIPKWDAQKSPELTNVGLVPVLFADYGKTYSIQIDGTTVASYTTPDGSQPGHINNVDTTFVAQTLANKFTGTGSTSVTVPSEMVRFDGSGEIRSIQKSLLQGVETKDIQYIQVPVYDSGWKLGIHSEDSRFWYFRTPKAFSYEKLDAIVHYVSAGVTGVTCEIDGNVLIIRKDTPFKLGTTDGRDGKDMPAIKHAVTEVALLPPRAPVGYKVQITGKGKKPEERYWLEAADGDSAARVTWVETVAPETYINFDRRTMPQVIVQEYVNDRWQFRVKQAEWAQRRVGDDFSNKPPSFLEDEAPIVALGTYQNRLFFLAGESFVASQSNEFFNFFKTTTQTEEEDRPIDKYADTEEINNLKSYASLDGDLVLFSDNAQFIIKGDKAITADNMNMRLVTQYKNNSHIKPATTGETTLFSYNVGQYVQIREFFTDSYTDTKKARPITEHVDRLIKGNVIQMVGSTNVSNIIVRTDDDLSKMFMYDYLWQGADKVQSAWWVFSARPEDKIRYAVYDRSELRLIVDRHGIGCCLESYDVGDPDDSGIGFSLRYDNKRKFSVTRSPINPQVWVAHLPQDFAGEIGHKVDVILGNGCHPEEIGNTIEAVHKPEGYIIDPADLAPEGVNQVECWYGIPYTASFIPTNPIIKDDKNNEYGLDRLTINTMYINYDSTGSFSASVKNKWGQTRDYQYSGRVMGRVGNIVGFAKLYSGQFPVPVRDKNANIEMTLWSDSYLPFVVRNLEWKGMINLRGRRV